MYLKEAASKLVQIGHQSLETIGNLLNVNRAATMGERESSSGISEQNLEKNPDRFVCKCDQKLKKRRNLVLTQSVNISEAASILNQGGGSKPVKVHNQIKATITTENLMQVRIHRLDLEGEFE